jgi:hypothetical protein
MSIQIGMETSNIIVLCYVLKEFWSFQHWR